MLYNLLFSSLIPRFNEIEVRLIVERRAGGAVLSGVYIRAKAMSIALGLQITDFKGSEGWLLRFLYRKKLVLRQV